MVKDKDIQFCMENLKRKRKRKRLKKVNDLPERGFEAQIFLIFLPILIFMKGKGDGIKSRQPSKIFSTLKVEMLSNLTTFLSTILKGLKYQKA